MPPPKLLALTPCLPAELLTFVLSQTYPTTIIICSTRNTFLSALLKGTTLPVSEPEIAQSPTEQVNPPASTSGDLAITEGDTIRALPFIQKHPLLIPTLHQISCSRHIKTTFVPTVSHLRAYLSVLTSNPSFEAPIQEYGARLDTVVTQTPVLLVYGLIELHHETSEWSTQGLGNTLAGLVEAGARTGQRVVIVEKREEVEDEERAVDDGGEADSDEEEKAARAETLRQRRHEGVWHERLPILNGNVRRIGADAEYVGRTVEVGMVLRRWFKFGRGNWEMGAVQNGEE